MCAMNLCPWRRCRAHARSVFAGEEDVTGAAEQGLRDPEVDIHVEVSASAANWRPRVGHGRPLVELREPKIR